MNELMSDDLLATFIDDLLPCWLVDGAKFRAERRLADSEIKLA
jgi:hypothetical protein